MVPYTKKFQDRILILQLMCYKVKAGFNVTYRWIKRAAYVVYRDGRNIPVLSREFHLDTEYAWNDI
jgi:peroxiredoxin